MGTVKPILIQARMRYATAKDHTLASTMGNQYIGGCLQDREQMPRPVWVFGHLVVPEYLGTYLYYPGERYEYRTYVQCTMFVPISVNR